MAVKKATTMGEIHADANKAAAGGDLGDPVLGGPPAEDPTPTVPVGAPVPDSINLTDSEPDKPSDKPVTMTSPWGSKVTVSSDFNADDFSNLGYKKSK